MQIHELPAGSPASGLQFAGDTGSQTQKIDYDALANAILSKLTTKTFDIKSESQTIIAALNALGDASKQGVANNLVTTAAGLVLDARQGKALKDLHDTNASDIASLNSMIASDTGGLPIRRAGIIQNNESITLNITSSFSANEGYILLGLNVSGDSIAGFALLCLSRGTNKKKDLIGAMNAAFYSANYSAYAWTIKNTSGSIMYYTALISK